MDFFSGDKDFYDPDCYPLINPLNKDRGLYENFKKDLDKILDSVSEIISIISDFSLLLNKGSFVLKSVIAIRGFIRIRDKLLEFPHDLKITRSSLVEHVLIPLAVEDFLKSGFTRSSCFQEINSYQRKILSIANDYKKYFNLILGPNF